MIRYLMMLIVLLASSGCSQLREAIIQRDINYIHKQFEHNLMLYNNKFNQHKEFLEKCEHLTIESDVNDMIDCDKKLTHGYKIKEIRRINDLENHIINYNCRLIDVKNKACDILKKQIVNNEIISLKKENDKRKYIQNLILKIDELKDTKDKEEKRKLSRFLSKYNKTSMCMVANFEYYRGSEKGCLYPIRSYENRVIQKIGKNYLVMAEGSNFIYLVTGAKLSQEETLVIRGIRAIENGNYVYVKDVTYTTIQGFEKTVPLLKKLKN